MTKSEPQDGNMFDDGFVGGCGVFETLFTSCCCFKNFKINADNKLRADKYDNNFLLYMEIRQTPNICPSVPNK